MALDLSEEALGHRIDSLRTGFEGYQAEIRDRNRAYLRLYSPPWEGRLKEHDQWDEDFKAQSVGHARGSYNLARPVVELWTSLEAYPFPNFAWTEQYVPAPVPSLDPNENSRRAQTHRAMRLVTRQIATMREQAVAKHHRVGRLERHYYRTILRKNLYGQGWLRAMPDLDGERFVYKSSYDPSTVYPVWAAWDENELAAILCVTRKNARAMHDQYPDAVEMTADGNEASSFDHYQPTATVTNMEDRSYVWVEDYWILDRKYEQTTNDGPPVKSLVVNALRVNGKIVERVEYPGWRTIPYFHFENDNLRDKLGFSDVATIAPLQDALNRFISQQQDVIAGESRPKFKYRSENPRELTLHDEGYIELDPDEDIEQLQVHLDVFPTQVHGTQLMDILARITGLNDSVWGRIVASQNSGRALATAWRSVAARLVPRLQSDADALDRLASFELETMELYDWDSAQELFNGNRDYQIDFPNQEPRDFLEVTQDAINRLNAGLIDAQAAMESTGEKSPDEMDDRVRSEYNDPVRHPEKAQSYILLAREQQQMKIEAAQAQQQLAAQQQNALAAAANTPPGAAPGGANGGPTPGSRAAAQQAATQAAQQSAPTVQPGAPQPATQAGQPANAANVQSSTLVQDGGAARNRIIAKY